MKKLFDHAATLASATLSGVSKHLGAVLFLAAITLATVFFSTSTARAITPAMSGTLNSADPSPLVYDGSSTFYQFTTGTQGVWYSTSPNITDWTSGGYISPSGTNGVYPSWITTEVPSWTVGNIWAPDVVKIGSIYYMYYAVSSFGTSTSAIGLSAVVPVVRTGFSGL